LQYLDTSLCNVTHSLRDHRRSSTSQANDGRCLRQIGVPESARPVNINFGSYCKPALHILARIRETYSTKMAPSNRKEASPPRHQHHMAHASAANLAEPTTTVASDLATPLISCPVAHMDPAESPEPASHRVSKTTELLENILSFLPTNDIFTVQQVSKPWKEAIATSPSIQRKLFIRPTNQEPET
jgi:hypothetical protein